jgi:hypothetical protein
MASMPKISCAGMKAALLAPRVCPSPRGVLEVAAAGCGIAAIVFYLYPAAMEAAARRDALQKECRTVPPASYSQALRRQCKLLQARPGAFA